MMILLLQFKLIIIPTVDRRTQRYAIVMHSCKLAILVRSSLSYWNFMIKYYIGIPIRDDTIQVHRTLIVVYSSGKDDNGPPLKTFKLGGGALWLDDLLYIFVSWHNNLNHNEHLPYITNPSILNYIIYASYFLSLYLYLQYN